jgi:type I restriction enzyme S subunit
MTLMALGDTARFINGAAFKPTDWEDEGLPIIRIQNLTGTGEKFNLTTRTVKPELIVEPGDLLVSWSATLDVYRWAGPRGLLNQHIFKVLPNSDIDPEYLFYALKNALAELSSKTHGSTMKHVVRGDFESTQVNVPPLPEQRSIVDLLSRAEGIVRLRREAEKKAAELIPALFLDMFGDPGANPKGWKTVPTGEVVQLTNGRAFKPAEWSDEGTPIIRIQNLNDPSKPFNYYAGDLPEKYKVRAGDVLLSWSGTPGTSFGCFRWQREDGWLNQHIFNVRVAEHINEDFFIHQINLQLPELIGRAHGGVGLQHFTKGALESLPFIVPTTTEQERFGEQAAQADSIQQQQAAATAKAQAAFDALLSGAFSG